MIILYQRDRFRAVHLLIESLGEFEIHPLVLLPVLFFEIGSGMRDMTERPQSLVGETIIIALLLLFAEPNSLERVLGFSGRNENKAILVGGLAVGRAAAVADPHSRAGAQNGLDGAHKTAR